MKDKIIKVTGFRKFGKSSFISFDNDFKSIQPGQFLLSYHPLKDDLIKQIFYVTRIDETYFSIPENSNWEIGDELIFKGPGGNSFTDFSLAQNLLLISAGKTKGGLLSIIDNGIKKGKNIAYLTNDPDLPLPNSIEILTPDMLDDSLQWADSVSIEIDREDLINFTNLLQKVKTTRKSSEILIYSPILCSGESHCMICAIKTTKRWVRSCHNGAVFKIFDLELP